MSPPSVATFSPSRVSHAGGTASGFQARILDHCRAHGVEISTSKARKLGVRIARRAERQQQEHDFYTALRVLGIYDDETARQAVYSVEGRGS